MNKEFIKYLLRVGQTRERLKTLLDHKLFENLNKHNLFWQTEDDEIDEKLSEIRMFLSYVENELYDVFVQLDVREDDE